MRHFVKEIFDDLSIAILCSRPCRCVEISISERSHHRPAFSATRMKARCQAEAKLASLARYQQYADFTMRHANGQSCSQHQLKLACRHYEDVAMAPLHKGSGDFAAGSSWCRCPNARSASHRGGLLMCSKRHRRQRHGAKRSHDRIFIALSPATRIFGEAVFCRRRPDKLAIAGMLRHQYGWRMAIARPSRRAETGFA